MCCWDHDRKLGGLCRGKGRRDPGNVSPKAQGGGRQKARGAQHLPQGPRWEEGGHPAGLEAPGTSGGDSAGPSRALPRLVYTAFHAGPKLNDARRGLAARAQGESLETLFCLLAQFSIGFK